MEFLVVQFLIMVGQKIFPENLLNIITRWKIIEIFEQYFAVVIESFFLIYGDNQLPKPVTSIE